jgi:hypothetical protein
VKRLSADDSVHSHVKVGHRQALQFRATNPITRKSVGFLFFYLFVSPYKLSTNRLIGSTLLPLKNSTGDKVPTKVIWLVPFTVTRLVN